MRKVKTLRFGEIEATEDHIIHFDEGIPAFEEETEFVIIIPDVEAPYAFLQSTKTQELAFLMARPFVFFPDYEFVLDDTVEAHLDIKDEKDVEVFTLVTVPDGDFSKMTANLLAPIVINNENRKGQQYVLEKTKYTTRHPLFAAKEGE